MPLSSIDPPDERDYATRAGYDAAIAESKAAEKVRAKLSAAQQRTAEVAAYLVGVRAALPPMAPEAEIEALIAAGIERALAGPPIIRRGDVVLTLYHELGQLIGEWQRGRRLAEKAAVAADDGPAAWMKLYDGIQMEREK